MLLENPVSGGLPVIVSKNLDEETVSLSPPLVPNMVNVCYGFSLTVLPLFRNERVLIAFFMMSEFLKICKVTVLIDQINKMHACY